MVRKSRLIAALDAHKGKDYRLEKQKILQKNAAKRKRTTTAAQELRDDTLSEQGAVSNGVGLQLEKDSDAWESDKSREALNIHGSQLRASNSSDNDGNNIIEVEEGTGVPDESRQGLVSDPESDNSDGSILLSDIESRSSDEKGDMIRHQRLTINNTSALLRAHKSIALPTTSLPFSAHQSVLSAVQISISDVSDDLSRELAFYKQCLDAATEARSLLKKEGVLFTRPIDYFAEMVKNDEHMGKVKEKMTEEAANKKASAEARRQRDLKRFGKQVQVAKLQERDRAKRDTLDKINILKRKRKDADTSNANEEDLFDVALEDASRADKAVHSSRRDVKGAIQDKRQRKDAKFGFGGRKRFAKSGDAVSTGDIQGFSSKKMKGIKKGQQRLGKSRRAKV